MNYTNISQTGLFQDITEEETKEMLDCFQAASRTYRKGEYIYRMGDRVQALGLVLAGSVNVEKDDIWGNQSIFDNVGAGQVFAEAYSCVPGEPLMVSVRAAEAAEILFLNVEKLLFTCSSACVFHIRLVKNLLMVMAEKNLNLSRKISHTTSKSVRGRLISYLSSQAVQKGDCRFEIPFNRQQMADYLGVDRSALSNELSKMQKDGLLEYHKNRFWLKKTAEILS